MAGQNHLSGAHVLTDLPDVLPGSGGSVDGDGTILVLHDVLHHDDGIPLLGNGVAGVQHNILILLQRDRGGFRCAKGVLCPHCHTVHSAGGIVRGANMGVDRPGSHPSSSLADGDDFRFGCEAVVFQQLQIVGACLLQRHIGQIFKSHFYSPEQTVT